MGLPERTEIMKIELPEGWVKMTHEEVREASTRDLAEYGARLIAATGYRWIYDDNAHLDHEIIPELAYRRQCGPTETMVDLQHRATMVEL